MQHASSRKGGMHRILYHPALLMLVLAPRRGRTTLSSFENSVLITG